MDWIKAAECETWKYLLSHCAVEMTLDRHVGGSLINHGKIITLKKEESNPDTIIDRLPSFY